MIKISQLTKKELIILIELSSNDSVNTGYSPAHIQKWFGILIEYSVPST